MPVWRLEALSVAFQEDLPANEHLTMLLTQRVFGIDVAVNACVRLADGELAYLTKRFDRRDGARIPQEDFCQLTGRNPDTHGHEYMYDGSYEELGALLRTYCSAHRVEVEKLYRMIVCTYALSNGDAHLKNFSLHRSEFGDFVLTPAYDLVCTSLHIPEESRLALDLFDDLETPSLQARGFVTGACLLELARRYGIEPRRAQRLLAPFLEERADVLALIEASFLSEPAKVDYRARYLDRLEALRAGLEGAR